MTEVNIQKYGQRNVWKLCL